MSLRRCSSGGRGGGLASAFVRFPREERRLVEVEDHVGRTPLGAGCPLRQGADPQDALEGGAGGEQKVERAAEGGEDTLPANAENSMASSRLAPGSALQRVVGVHLPVAVECLVKALARRAPLADVFKNVGTQTKRVSNLLQPRRNVAEKAQQSRWATSLGRSSRNKPPPWRARKGEGGQPQLGHAHGRDQNI